LLLLDQLGTTYFGFGVAIGEVRSGVSSGESNGIGNGDSKSGVGSGESGFIDGAAIAGSAVGAAIGLTADPIGIGVDPGSTNLAQPAIKIEHNIIQIIFFVIMSPEVSSAHRSMDKP
jgi:hypothetical protein